MAALRPPPAIVLLLLGVSCTDLEPTTTGACGNGVVDDATEDCDGFIDPILGGPLNCGEPHDGPRACRLLCGAQGENAEEECPAGWACAPEGFCHHGSDSFETANSVDFAASHWAVRDVDRDGTLDLVGLQNGSLSVRFGISPGAFEPGHSTPVIETPFGRPAFEDLDGDDFVDVSVPSTSGVLVLRGTGERAEPFEPVAFLPVRLLVADIRQYSVRPAANSKPEGAATIQLGQFATGVSCVARPSPPIVQTPSWQPLQEASHLKEIGGTVADLDNDSIDELVLSLSSEPWQLVVLTTKAGPGALAPVTADEGYSGSLTGSAGTARVALKKQPVPGARPIVADLDGDGYADVVVPHAGGWTILRGLETGLGEPEELALTIQGAASAAPKPLAVADFNRDDVLDWVTTEGIFLGTSPIQGQNLKLVSCHPVAAGVEWLDAVVLQREGQLDLAVTAGSQQEATSLFWLRSKCGDSAQGSCQSLVFTEDAVVIRGSPRELRRADMDGDSIDDLVFLDRVGEEDLVTVSFSLGAAGPRETRTMLRARAGVQMDAGLYNTLISNFDGAEDLQLAAPSDDQSVRLGVLTGNMRRATYMPLALGKEFLEAEAAMDVVAGPFDPSRPGDRHLSALTPDGNLYFSTMAAALELDAITKRVTDVELVCQNESGSSIGAVAWTRLDTSGDGRLELVGLSPRAECKPDGRSPSLVTYSPITGRLDPLRALEDMAQISALTNADLDGDGASDLIAAVPSGVVVLYGPDFAGRHVLFELPEPTALAVIQTDADPQLEIAVLTRTFLVIIKSKGRGEPAERLWDAPIGGTSLAAADVNDGITDLLVGDGERIIVLLAKPHRRAAGAP
jgi:hypothetical protein